jgi:hypothetical protein
MARSELRTGFQAPYSTTARKSATAAAPSAAVLRRAASRRSRAPAAAINAAPIRTAGPSCIVTKGRADVFQRPAVSGSESSTRISTKTTVSVANPATGQAMRRLTLPRASAAMPKAIRAGEAISA